MMSSAAGGKRHGSERELVAFLERQDQTAAYVRRTAEWIKDEYPGSAPALLPRLRALYRAKVLAERR
jgi:hypothetical protein